jgi:hypothetical protein
VHTTENYTLAYVRSKAKSQGANKMSVGVSTLRQIVVAILKKRYHNGFIINSAQECDNFRTCVNELYGVELELTDEELQEEIKKIGIVDEGKVYLVSSGTKDKIREKVEK